jgi:hypothetical protein
MHLIGSRRNSVREATSDRAFAWMVRSHREISIDGLPVIRSEC